VGKRKILNPGGWKGVKAALLPPGIRRLRPRNFFEWKALRRWGKLPAWEPDSVGYLLRLAREEAGLTQSELAKRLRCTQQAVAQAERWQSNPTVEFLRSWATQCGRAIEICIGAYGVKAPDQAAALVGRARGQSGLTEREALKLAVSQIRASKRAKSRRQVSS
jgi:transcriptional regulator with XRE-family HTH domain